MTRKKVKLAFITNDSARKATFKKRKKGLMKKVSELSTLCGIEACAIVYSPYESQPEVWPDCRGAQRVVGQLKRMPEMEQSKKMVNQETFIRQRVGKAAEQLKKVRKENREKEMTQLMYECLTGKGVQGLPLPDLNDVGWLVEQNLKEIYKRIDGMKKEGVGNSNSNNNNGSVNGGGMERTQWFTEWMGSGSGSGNDQMQMGGGGDEMVMPFNDGTNNPVIWSNLFFP